MIIRLKNKNEIAMSRMISECKEKGGKPDYIELTPTEALDVIKELQACENGYPSDFDIGLESEVRLIANSSTPITHEQANRVINQWIRNEFSVSYKSIPLKVIYKRKKPTDLPPIDGVDKNPKT